MEPLSVGSSPDEHEQGVGIGSRRGSVSDISEDKPGEVVLAEGNDSSELIEEILALARAARIMAGAKSSPVTV